MGHKVLPRCYRWFRGPLDEEVQQSVTNRSSRANLVPRTIGYVTFSVQPEALSVGIEHCDRVEERVIGALEEADRQHLASARAWRKGQYTKHERATGRGLNFTRSRCTNGNRFSFLRCVDRS